MYTFSIPKWLVHTTFAALVVVVLAGFQWSKSANQMPSVPTCSVPIGAVLCYADGDREHLRRPVQVRIFRYGRVLLKPDQFVTFTMRTDGQGFYRGRPEVPVDSKIKPLIDAVLR